MGDKVEHQADRTEEDRTNWPRRLNTILVINYQDTRERLWTLSEMRSLATAVKKQKPDHVCLTLAEYQVSQCAECQWVFMQMSCVCWWGREAWLWAEREKGLSVALTVIQWSQILKITRWCAQAEAYRHEPRVKHRYMYTDKHICAMKNVPWGRLCSQR